MLIRPVVWLIAATATLCVSCQGAPQQVMPVPAPVSLPGTYTIEGALRGKVYAFSETEIAGFMGKAVVITSSSLTTPWLECEPAAWTREDLLPRDQWLPSSPQVADESKLLEDLAANNESAVPWRSPCGAVEARLMQLVPSGTVAMSWDGVTFIARSTRPAVHGA